MPLSSPLLSLVLATAPTGPTVVPQMRAIDPAAMAQEASSRVPAVHDPQKTRSPDPGDQHLTQETDTQSSHQNDTNPASLPGPDTSNLSQKACSIDPGGHGINSDPDPHEGIAGSDLPSNSAAPAGAARLESPSAATTRPQRTRRARTGPAEFDRSPVYLGCGHRSPACERLTTVGLISGGTGLALIAGSVGLVLTPDQVIADEPAYVRNYSRVGTTLLALGIGLATTGVLMVFTAAKASRRRRKTTKIAAQQ